VVSFVGSGQIDLEVQQVNSFKTIIYQKEGGVARITLNRPEVRNAVNLELITELNEALSTARGDEGVRVVVITGAGSAFCSGIDLAFHRGKTGLEYREPRFFSPLHIFTLDKARGSPIGTYLQMCMSSQV
jgi:enoyl-CoA hydratase/carnithine racemase